MSSGGEISEKGKRARFARWEEIGVDLIKADLLAGRETLKNVRQGYFTWTSSSASRLGPSIITARVSPSL